MTGRGGGLLARMRANPAGDWTIADVERLCAAFGLLWRPGKGTSHVSIKHTSSMTILTIPAHRPIKAIYIRKLVRYIEDHGTPDAT